MAAIHGAEINGGVRQQLTTGQRVEFRFCVIAKENVVMREFRPMGRGGEGAYLGRQRPRQATGLAGDVGCGFAQQTGGQRARIAVEGDNIGFQMAAIRQRHACGFAIICRDFRDVAVKAELDPAGRGDVVQGACQLMHAAIHNPDTAFFSMPDQ